MKMGLKWNIIFMAALVGLILDSSNIANSEILRFDATDNGAILPQSDITQVNFNPKPNSFGT